MSMGRDEYDFEKIEGIEIKNRVKIVGIVFDKNLSAGDIKENWEIRIEKIKKIVKLWMKRNLSIIGKIQIIKTFLLSQFIYILQSLFIKKGVLDEINTIFYRFIWKRDSIDKKAWERVRRSVLCSTKEKGGLEMINLHEFHNSFLINWACKLLNDEEDEWKMIPLFFLQKIGGERLSLRVRLL